MSAPDIYQIISTRRSIRKYKSDSVEDEKLSRIIEAARLAPSANNRQPWHFIVIKDKQAREKLREVYSREWLSTAPIVIAAVGEPSISQYRKDRDFRDVDVSIAFEHLILAATAEGLGTCWIGAFDPEAARRVLKVPEGLEIIAFTPLGYPDETPEAKLRKSIKDIVHWNEW